MNAETFCEHFATLADAPNAITKLRELILQLAVHGKLGTQNENDEPATARSHNVNSIESMPFPSAEELPDAWPFDVPKNWQWLRLRDTPVTLKYGTSVKCDYEGNGVPVLRIPNVVGGQVDLGDLKFGALTDKEQTDLRLEKGDLLLIRSNGSTGIVGRTAVVHDNAVGFAYAGYLVRVRFPQQTWFPEFLHLAMISQTTREQIEGPIRTTSGVKNINSTEIGRLMLPLPPLAEQRRIVEKVDQLLGLCDELAARQASQREKRQRLVGATLDRLVSTRNPAEFPTHAHRLRNHFDQLFDTPNTIPQLRQTILQLAVQGQLVPQDPDDEPARCLRQRLAVFVTELQESGRTSRRKLLPEIDESDLPFSLPEQWAWVRFGELAAEVEYGTSQKASEIGGDVPVLRMNAIRDGRVVLEESKFVASTIKDLPKLYLKNGDILFNRTNSYELVGKSGVFYGPDNKFTFASYLIRASLLPELLPEFITIAMNAKYYRTTQIEPEVTQQCGQANFNGTKLQHSLIPLPPLAEQKRIVTKVTELLSLCDALEAKLNQAESASTQLLSSAVHLLLNGSAV